VFRRFLRSIPTERRAWCSVGFGVIAIAGAFAFTIWVTVRSHPEQDLPLWPAWIFTAIAIIGLAILVAGLVDGPRRDH
jgi:hypothetical protein